MLVNFSFFDDNEVIIVPLYSASNAPLMASVVESPELKEAEKATRKKPEPKKEEPKPEVKKEEPKMEVTPASYGGNGFFKDEFNRQSNNGRRQRCPRISRWCPTD